MLSATISPTRFRIIGASAIGGVVERRIHHKPDKHVGRTTQERRTCRCRVGLISEAFPNAKVIDRREKPSHGYRAVHIVIEVNERFVEIQIRTELQHLWAVWSEALADSYGQALKYGSGPAEIQEILTLQSEIFRLLEEREEIMATSLKIVDERTGARSLADVASNKSLPAEVLEGMRWSGHLKDLIRRKEEEKEQITREILKLKRKRKER